MKKLRVGVVDDSGFMRLILSDIINADSQLEVVATGENGKEAVKLAKTGNLDVLVLDMIMGEYDGKYAIREIMKDKPMPILVVSSLEDKGNDIEEILELGAYEFISKPTGKKHLRDLSILLNEKIKSAKSGFKTQQSVTVKANTNPHTFTDKLHYKAIVVGSSTGGPSTVEQFLKSLPANLPVPVIIAQHMPANFIQAYAGRLDKMCPFPVKHAITGERIFSGRVYVLSGLSNQTLELTRGHVTVGETPEKFRHFNNPSVDALFLTAAEVYGPELIGIVLTGMGADGKKGIAAIKDAGGRTLAQDEATSVVYGMPREAFLTGKVDHVLPIQEMGGFVVTCLS